MHSQDSADAFLFVLSDVVNVAAALQCSGVNPEINQTANERVSGDFKRQGGERL